MVSGPHIIQASTKDKKEKLSKRNKNVRLKVI